MRTVTRTHNGCNYAALDASVLVLNRHFTVVHIVPARRAFCLLYKSQAEVIDVEDGTFLSYDFDSWVQISQLRRLQKKADDDWIRTVRCEIQVPRVIRLLSYDKIPQDTVKFNRRNILARDNFRCQYCGRKFPSHQLTLDHVIPRSRGGKMVWENVVCACISCNLKKGDRTPAEANMRLIRPPKRPHRNPVLTLKLRSVKYHSWRMFLSGQNGDGNGDGKAP
jgi:5-methylcytosine-specific restriction endonuclease McrA